MTVLVVAHDADWLRLAGAALGRAGVDVRTVRARDERTDRLVREQRAEVVVLEGGEPTAALRRTILASGSILMTVAADAKWSAPGVLAERVRGALAQHAAQGQEALAVRRIGPACPSRS